MNYFELFEIPVQLTIDKSSLFQKFFELSKKYHPDYFINESAEKQTEALEKSALLNKAFKIFQNTDETIKYVLQLKGLLEEEEKYQLPPDFLAKVMDINEQLMEVDDNPELKSGLQEAINKLQSEIYKPVKELVEHYQDGHATEKELLQIKDYYYKKKYIDRIRQQVL